MGSTLGTPQYMSPEQADGRLDLLGPASDVYSLGATLYYVLTGKPPIEARDLATVLKKVRTGDIPPPRATNSEIPKPLEAICLKAMALKPDDRYPTPKQLADDIERWLADEPVTAYREPWMVRGARWGRKHKTAVAALFALLTTATVSLGVSTFLISASRCTNDARKQAETNADALRNGHICQPADDSPSAAERTSCAAARLRLDCRTGLPGLPGRRSIPGRRVAATVYSRRGKRGYSRL